jgi:hypothetical protein
MDMRNLLATQVSLTYPQDANFAVLIITKNPYKTLESKISEIKL